jgi:putative phosphoribosyl transferase
VLWTPVDISAAGTTLDGDLVAAAPGRRHVVFAHGSGSSRHSPRNRAVAARLVKAGLGVLLFDLLTDEESTDRRLVFDIPLLAERLVSATAWLTTRGTLAPGPGSVGYFGASTGAAAALWAAADPQVADVVGAVVSRGGRPDLAEPRLAAVTAPTLMIVGGDDQDVLALNNRARALMRCRTDLVVIPGATHLFSEPGALERVADLAADWFTQ